jgi:flagellar basal-body rod modification protein FlgD
MTTVTTDSASTATTSAASGSSSAALTSLSGDFNSFLKLLMTQLQNQDPTSPLDTNQFTSQLVQFASVEQQINTNTSLTHLIELTQGNSTLQSAAIVGKQATYSSSSLQLQDGTASVGFTLSSAQNVRIVVTGGSGQTLVDTNAAAPAGANVWTWNGLNQSGVSMPDGTYKVAVTPTTAGATAIATQMTGKVGAVSAGSTDPTLLIGGVQVPLSAVQSLMN